MGCRVKPGNDGMGALSLRRHHRHALIAGADPVGGGREIQRRAALVDAPGGHQRTAGTDHDVALAKRRVVFDLDRCEADLLTAVAGASRDDLVAIAERIRQFPIRLAALGYGIIDIAAVDHFGLAGAFENFSPGPTAPATCGPHARTTP